MSDFSYVKTVKANKVHRCCECRGEIHKSDKYEKSFIVQDGDVSEYKVCKHCCESRDWLLDHTDWNHDIDGEGHSFYYTMLRDHLKEQAIYGDKTFSFACYRHIARMDKRRKNA